MMFKAGTVENQNAHRRKKQGDGNDYEGADDQTNLRGSMGDPNM